MEYKLTCKYQRRHKDKDHKNRNYILYFLNGILILKQKDPYETGWEIDYSLHTWIENEYLLNGRLHQTRTKFKYGGGKKKIRQVSYPISKDKLKAFVIPKDMRIEITQPEKP